MKPAVETRQVWQMEGKTKKNKILQILMVIRWTSRGLKKPDFEVGHQRQTSEETRNRQKKEKKREKSLVSKLRLKTTSWAASIWNHAPKTNINDSRNKCRYRKKKKKYKKRRPWSRSWDKGKVHQQRVYQTSLSNQSFKSIFQTNPIFQIWLSNQSFKPIFQIWLSNQSFKPIFQSFKPVFQSFKPIFQSFKPVFQTNLSGESFKAVT
jgi:outer membrane receptor for ferrienterochelin and colicin